MIMESFPNTASYQWTTPEKSFLFKSEPGIEDLWIPVNPENSDYQVFLKWIAEGNEPLPAPPPIIGNIQDLTEAKKVAGDYVRSEAYSRLLPTDWVVTREMETGTPAPADITAYRTAVRTASADKISTIESKGKLSTLATYLRSPEFAEWPQAPTA